MKINNPLPMGITQHKAKVFMNLNIGRAQDV